MPPTPCRLHYLGSYTWSKWLTFEGSSNSHHNRSHYTLQEWTWEQYRGLNLTFFTPSARRSQRVFIWGLSRCLGRSLGSGGPLVGLAGHITWSSDQALWQYHLSHTGCPSCRLKLTSVEDGFSKDAKPCLAGPTLARLGPGFVPQHPLVSYCRWLPLVLDIMKICMDFCPYDAFPSFDIPKMVNQKNSWNSLVISTYLLYLEWNVGMLVVSICILWLPTPPSPHPTYLEFCSSLSKRKELNPRDIIKNSSAIIAQEWGIQLTTHTWALWMCLSLELYDVKRLEQLCHFTSRSMLVITWFTLPSPFLKLYHSSSVSLLSS
jgi:hypothetical protein